MAELAVTAYTGNLLVVGGRAVRMSPPGALAETAPKRANRAREDDTFFILITPDEHTHASAGVFEALAQLGADTYFGSSGGITSGLREALAAINAQLVAQGNNTRVDALALALRGTDLYAARSGRTFSLLLQWPNLTAFPTDRHDPLVMNLRPLGADPTPDIQLTRYTVAPGQALLITEPSLNARSDDELRIALSAENVGSMIEKIKALAGEQTAASVIRFMAPDIPDSTGNVPQPSAREPAHAAPRGPQPRASTPPPQPIQPAAASIPAPQPDYLDPMPRPAAPPEPAAPGASFERDDDRDSPAESAPHAAPFPPEDVIALHDSVRAEAEAAQAQVAGTATGDETHTNPLASGMSALLTRLRPEPVDSPARRSGPSPLHRATVTIRRTVRDMLRGMLAVLFAVTGAITSVFDRLIPAPDEHGRQGIPTNIAVGMAVLIPAVIVIVVVGLALSEQGKGEFQIYLDRAKSAHQEALELSGTSCENPAHRLLWVEVLRLAEQASEYRPNDQDVLIISADARNYLDCFDKVERRDLKLLHEFASDAELVGPVVNGGVDIYTLDRHNGRIYHDTLNETGDNLTTRDDSPIIYTGQVISNASGNFTVDELIDIEWLTAGGTAHDNVLIALDRKGQLLAYSPTFFASAQQLVIEGRWVNPVALAVFRSNLYILDAGANQIWRYIPPAGERAYSNAPEEYFNGDELPDLANAVDFGISDEGAVYVLFKDGSIKRFRRNTQSIVEEQPFDIREDPEGVLESGVALFVDNDPLSRQLYMVDPATDAIYETLWGGKFRRGYRPGNLPKAFDNVSGIFADAVVRNNMYVLAGNKLYQFNRNP